MQVILGRRLVVSGAIERGRIDIRRGVKGRVTGSFYFVFHAWMWGIFGVVIKSMRLLDG
jgi:hypothetical protein